MITNIKVMKGRGGEGFMKETMSRRAVFGGVNRGGVCQIVF